MGEKNYEITNYIAKYEPTKRKRLERIRTMIHENIVEIREKM